MGWMGRLGLKWEGSVGVSCWAGVLLFEPGGLVDATKCIGVDADGGLRGCVGFCLKGLVC
eukprot:7880399-Karenia_brevis.AAC.1